MHRTIDGFMPRAAARRAAPAYSKRPAAPPTTHTPQPIPKKVTKPPVPVTAIRAPQPAQLTPQHSYAQPAPAPVHRGFPDRLQLPIIIVGAMLAGIFAQSAVFGEILVVLYGIAAFIWNIASRTTFTLALLSMVATTLLLVVRGNIPLAQNFATYTFLLLVVGVITLTRELKKEGGRIYSNRKNIS